MQIEPDRRQVLVLDCLFRQGSDDADNVLVCAALHAVVCKRLIDLVPCGRYNFLLGDGVDVVQFCRNHGVVGIDQAFIVEADCTVIVLDLDAVKAQMAVAPGKL